MLFWDQQMIGKCHLMDYFLLEPGVAAQRSQERPWLSAACNARDERMRAC